jgi:hypothetical protein
LLRKRHSKKESEEIWGCHSKVVKENEMTGDESKEENIRKVMFFFQFLVS